MNETVLNKKMYKNLAFYNNRYHLYTECVKNATDSNDNIRCEFIKGRLSNVHAKITSNVNELLILLNNNKSIGNTSEMLRDKILNNNYLREKLQKELDGLYVSEERGKPYDFAIESGLLWILLTTTCIYFVIVKL